MKLTDAQVRALQALAFHPATASNFSGVVLQGTFVQYAAADSLIALGYARITKRAAEVAPASRVAGGDLIEITTEGRTAATTCIGDWRDSAESCADEVVGPTSTETLR